MIAEFDLNPTLPGVADPYPTYRAIRESDPVHWCTGAELWAITRYSDADAVLKDPRFSRQAFLDRVETRMGHQSIIEMQRHELVFMDNPRHHSLRRLLGEAITPAVIQTLRPGIEQVVQQRLEPLLARGRMDVIGDFSRTLPTEIAAMWLGVPAAERPQIVDWIFPLVAGRGVARDPETTAAANAAAQNFTNYFRNLMAQRRREPRGDLISSLLRIADANSELLSDADLLGVIIAVFAAGHGPGIAMLANTLLALLRVPGLLKQVQDHPDWLPATLEEGLRFDPPTQAPNPVVATADVALADKSIRKGQVVSVIIAAANRDPAAFPDPDRFDPARHPNRHLAFSGGEHYCLGAQLVRAEGQQFLATLLSRLKDLKLAIDESELRWVPHDRFRTLESLPVTFRSSMLKAKC